MFWLGWGKIVKGWRLAMLDGRMGMQLSASLREESDPPSSVTVMITPEFQSTLPRRERP